jgi:hypothetical protein
MTCAEGGLSCEGEIGPTAESCNGIDDNCDGQIDNAPTIGTRWYRDQDVDGFGDANDTGVIACSQPSGRVSNNTDCDDTNLAIRPGVSDPPGGVDQNCDGVP